MSERTAEGVTKTIERVIIFILFEGYQTYTYRFTDITLSIQPYIIIQTYVDHVIQVVKCVQNMYLHKIVWEMAFAGFHTCFPAAYRRLKGAVQYYRLLWLLYNLE